MSQVRRGFTGRRTQPKSHPESHRCTGRARAVTYDVADEFVLAYIQHGRPPGHVRAAGSCLSVATHLEKVPGARASARSPHSPTPATNGGPQARLPGRCGQPAARRPPPTQARQPAVRLPDCRHADLGRIGSEACCSAKGGAGACKIAANADRLGRPMQSSARPHRRDRFATAAAVRPRWPSPGGGRGNTGIYERIMRGLRGFRARQGACSGAAVRPTMWRQLTPPAPATRIWA